MKNTYLFIIWNKALFCKDKILDDLSKDFEIVKSFYMEIPKNNFKESLLAFYGTKASNLDEKIFAIGNGKFYVVIVKDNNPSFEERKTYNGFELVNSKIYDKKWLYRKWTAGSFRIHSSQSENETIHDLSILLSNDFENDIDNINNNDLYYKDTLAKNNFDSLKEFIDSINQIHNSIVRTIDTNLVILTYNKTDILCYLNNSSTIIIGNKKYKLLIFGVEENEIDLSLFSNDDACGGFINIAYDYDNYLHNGISSDKLIVFSKNNNFKLNRDIKNTMRLSTGFSLKDKLIVLIKYYVKRIRYLFSI